MMLEDVPHRYREMPGSFTMPGESSLSISLAANPCWLTLTFMTAC